MKKLLIILLLIVGCDYAPTEHTHEEDCAGVVGGTAVEDIDGNCYATVQIGEQLWMAENLKTTHYNNGDEIPTGHTDEEWAELVIGAYSVYPADSSTTCGENCADIYGNLYNGLTVHDSRGVCMYGWHVSTDDEWKILTDFIAPEGIVSLDFNSVAGGKMKSTGTIEGGDGLWYAPNEGATNLSGFTALPAGSLYNYYSQQPNFSYEGIGTFSAFWSSPGGEWIHPYHQLNYDNSEVKYWMAVISYMNIFHSIRCIKD